MKTTVLFLLLLPAVTLGAIIHVPEDYPAISLALFNAEAGDTVLVTGGPYFEWDLNLPPGVSIVSPDYAGVTINALLQGRHFNLSGAEATYLIEGFELTAGRANAGGSIESGSANVDLTMRFCTLHDNASTGNGGAIYVIGSGSVLRIEDSQIYNNTAESNAGGLWVDGQVAGSTLYVENCAIQSNTAVGFDGGGMYLSDNVDAYFYNVQLAGNIAGRYGGGLTTNDGCEIEFHYCKFSGNSSIQGDDFYLDEAITIIYFSDFFGGVNYVRNTAQLTLICCGFYEGADPTEWGENVWIYNDDCDLLGITEEEYVLSAVRLFPNYPNPFNPSTIIHFTLPMTQAIRLCIYTVDGRHLATLINGELQPGPHSVTWNGTDEQGRPVASGTYIYRLEAGDYVEAKRMVLIR